ncbi:MULTISPECIES: hypothetical protein [Gluconobacter]|uniref:hypothetical protein n=1 Tax=Gluconobacter TaxID=441 RepID=UPI0039EB5866
MMTSALTDVTHYVQSHPNDVQRFGQDVNALVSIMGTVAKGIGAVYSWLPAPLRHAIGTGVETSALGAGLGSVVTGAA